jgi:hypothetical protein
LPLRQVRPTRTFRRRGPPTTPPHTGQVAAACAKPLGGITHTSAAPQTSASGTLLVYCTLPQPQPTDIALDVTVVVERSGTSSAFGWAQNKGSVVVAADQAPAKPPTKAPVTAPSPPVKPPTKTAVMAPSPPVKPPTKAPATAPVRPPTKAPTTTTSRPTVPTDNRGDNGGNGGNGNGNPGGRVRGWQGCLRRIRTNCPCRRPRTFRCARRVARTLCNRGRQGSRSSRQAFVKAVKEQFGAHCRRTAPRNRRGRNGGNVGGDVNGS